jgi:hypothetical protein
MKFYEIAVIKSAKIPGTKYVILQGGGGIAYTILNNIIIKLPTD